MIRIELGKNSYNIELERGNLAKAGELLNLNRKAMIITDEGVPRGYAETIAKQCKEAYIKVVPQGEGSKSLHAAEGILTEMLSYQFSRKDCVVAVGGGVVGDLAGFVAASYMRGVDFYNIPTTVLSQVDSSIGGKVAIDFSGYKNLVGAFYPPKAVIIDPETLKTLPERQISNGLAEAVKMALTSNAKLFDIFENKNIMENIDRIIEESLKIKRFVVENDERETGLRKILNFGHTLGHAIEVQKEGLYHGECVALGMLPMCSNEIRKRLIKVLEKLNLPTKISFDSDKIIEAMKHDKKISGDSITVITVDEIGSYKMEDIKFLELASKLKEVENI
jgi:3-dehydroquinate synthase